MNTAIWVAAFALSLPIVGAGVSKVLKSRAKLAASGQGWVEDFTTAQIKAIGVFEVIVGHGLVIPSGVDGIDDLTPISAIAIAVLMVGAAVTHGRRREWNNVAFNAVLFAVAVFIAVGRFA